MSEKLARLYKAPQPTMADPYAQIRWMFTQVESECQEPYAANVRWAANKYIRFVIETNASYAELENDKRFYLSLYWEADALNRFSEWLRKQDLASKSRYSLYKIVRHVMGMAYALRIIDTIVYHTSMPKGVSETKQRSAYTEDEEEVVNESIARWVGLANNVLNGYVPSGNGIPSRPQKFHFPSMVINGKTYSVSEAAAEFGVRYWQISEKLRMGMTPAQAVGVEPSPTAASMSVEVEGVVFRSITAAAKHYGVPERTALARLRKGHSPEQCVGLTPLYVSRKDERALLWMFENQFECDATKMYEHIIRERWYLGQWYGCQLGRIRQLFVRWGVWPYVDDRIVLPLAAQLGMLTGLNVEALKKLRLDSFQKQHRLTGEPVLIYEKHRAVSRSRTLERELHVPVLDELILDFDVAEKIEKLFGLVIALTARIREDAPEAIASTLFIFEDVDLSYKQGKRAIVPIEPKGKLATWYERFCADEGFHAIFGKEFRFTISRCRPTLATNLVLAGATLFDVQVVLGHASIMTTATYLDEQKLKPAFNRTVSQALSEIAKRSRDASQTEKAVERAKQQEPENEKDVFYETLSGCGCTNPFNPSDDVRAATKYVKGTVCKFWNMCIRCDSAIVTERSLPKLLVYRRRVGAVLETDSPAIRSRRELFEDTVQLIDGILEEGVVFDAPTIRQAEYQAATMDDILTDHLIYQGI
ncbi:site-specific integrase [Burkholderia vietnamiensis]|uniref:site-specific integrase n=1 Tax=Burkholderia vietnamiensis TaxID=60552 RepID=UPI001B9FFEBB|nr:site-specific integrase [Burkholderia vietnamiensis]MBR8219650.1 site-specific integrase [Burkholderia vietnamiensis]